MDKRRGSKALAKYAVNPVVESLQVSFRGGHYWRRPDARAEKRAEIPSATAFKGQTFWIVAEHGPHAGYVKNVKVNPRVRVRSRADGERAQRNSFMMTMRANSSENCGRSTRPSFA